MQKLLLTLLFTAAASFALKNRIIGGQNANAGQFPSTAAIQVTTSDSKYFCGGALFDINWVLTSGHCAYNAISFTIQLGSHTLEEGDDNRLIVSTSEYVIHPSFEPTSMKNDIALLKLRVPISYSMYIQPTTLPWVPLEAGATAISVGWGQISDSQAGLSETLQQTEVAILSNDECKLIYGNQIDDTMVCVSGNLNEGACTGDTGSPLYQLKIYHVYINTAIASFISGNGCESSDPSGYTRIYPHNQWIRNVTNTPAPY